MGSIFPRIIFLTLAMNHDFYTTAGGIYLDQMPITNTLIVACHHKK